MRSLTNLTKKTIIALAVGIYVMMLSISLTKAQDNPSTPQGVSSCSDSDSCLKAITQNTYGILQDLNTTIVSYLINLTTSDSGNNSPIASMQGNFTSLGNLINQYINPEGLIDPVQLSVDIVNSQPSDGNTTFSKSDYLGDKPKILNYLSQINDISYSTVVGQPPTLKAPATPYNYVKFISGMSIPHTLPLDEWGGLKQDKDKYKAYYNTVMSVESFNGYVLNGQYINAQNFNSVQTQLINQATSGDQWFAQIASEEIGKVLRQLLMFESQSYVLMTQLIQAQKQLLAALTMTNSLIILSNQQNECMMIAKAKGLKPNC